MDAKEGLKNFKRYFISINKFESKSKIIVDLLLLCYNVPCKQNKNSNLKVR